MASSTSERPRVAAMIFAEKASPSPPTHSRNRRWCASTDRPERQTPRPIVEGPQTAVIVGPPGEEIWPDKYGRVKVQFHWDREGNRDEKSSCWIRVSQPHAGPGFGGIDLPPFELPAQKTRSGMKSDTHQGSGNNEISMDDTAGNEQIRVNGQNNMDTTIGTHTTVEVGNYLAQKQPMHLLVNFKSIDAPLPEQLSAAADLFEPLPAAPA